MISRVVLRPGLISQTCNEFGQGIPFRPITEPNVHVLGYGSTVNLWRAEDTMQKCGTEFDKLRHHWQRTVINMDGLIQDVGLKELVDF